MCTSSDLVHRVPIRVDVGSTFFLKIVVRTLGVEIRSASGNSQMEASLLSV